MASTEKTPSPRLLDTFDPRRQTPDLNHLQADASTGRLIDSYHPGPRTREVRVLCMGMSRTGTMALFHGLQTLGFKPYHMAVAIGNTPRTSLGLWREALNAKYHGTSKPWGREEFDKMLGDFDGIADVPGICFAEDLVAAYPEAKVVLQRRDVDSWLRSMDSTAGAIFRWNWSFLAPWDPQLVGPFWEFSQILMPIAFRTYDFSQKTSPARAAFEDHYKHVREIVPKDRLLEYRVQDGWAPLCEFLNVDVPEGQDFPRVNDASEFIFAHSIMWWLAFGKMVGKVSLMAAVPAAGIAAAWWWRRRA